MTGVLITLAVIACLWLVGGCALQRKMLFPRFVIGDVPSDDIARPAGVERWTLDHDQGRTEAWFVPGEGVSDRTPGPAVVFAHGNAELIDNNVDWLRVYTERGVNVLLVEYRGYGRSDGSPSQVRITDDFVAGYDRLAARPDVDAQRIVFHGRSIGGGVACALASERRPAALVLQSAFTSTGAMAARYLYPPFLVLDPFDNAAVVRAYDGPVLILHGTADTIIPVSHGRKLHALAPDSSLIEYDCGHNDFPVDSARFAEDIEVFLREQHIIE